MRIYLAGPEVFLADAAAVADAKRAACARHGCTGIFPTDPPPAPPPEDTPGFRSSGRVSDDAGFAQFAEWDIRMVPRDELALLPGKASQQQVWFKHKDPLPDDPVLHICALTYMSDLTLLGSAQATHPEERANLMVASLDHAVWFMRPFRADEWLLYDQSSPSASGGRALTQGKIFNQRGDMVAAVMQEGLTRYKRGYSPPGR
jgi:acyl-CoA thioesterase-2